MLPLRGKILNVERARFDKMLGSDQIGTLITALGAGIGRDDFDIEKIRYHRIVVMTDADVDGAHIRTLLLTFFYRQMPQVIERGYLYIAQPPLYKADQGQVLALPEGRRRDGGLPGRRGRSTAPSSTSSGGERMTGARPGGPGADRRAHAKANIERLAARAPAFAIEQAALAGLFGETPRSGRGRRGGSISTPRRATAPWSGEAGEAAASSSRASGAASPSASCWTSLLLHSADARRLAERAARLWPRPSPAPATFRRRDRSQHACAARSTWSTAVFDAGRRGLTIQRYKGLGEMNPEQLWETTLDSNARTLLQVKVTHADDADDMFTRLMGDLVEPRREFIQDNALDAEVDV